MMQLQIPKRMEQFEEGIFQTLNDKILERKEKRLRVYNFSIGTPDFEPDEHVMQAVSRAASNPENYKYSLRDLPELTSAVIARYAIRYGVELAEDEITGVYGSQEGIAHIAFSLIDPGDVVLVPNPGYPIFGIGPSLAGASIRPYDLTEGKHYLPDLEDLERRYGKGAPAADRAKVMIVSYPLNPICKCAPDAFYEELIPWAIRNEILILHDNAYSDIIYDGRKGRSILSFPRAKEIAAEFYSLSKSFNYTGARMSFLIGDAELVRRFRKFRSQIDYGIFLPVQYGAIAALKGSDASVYEHCREYERRRDALCDGFTKLGWDFPRSEGTMFAWARIPEKYGTDDVRFVLELMEQAGIVFTPGSSFGSLGAGHVRFALVHPVHVIKEALAEAKASRILD